jgi:hypothetical protein
MIRIIRDLRETADVVSAQLECDSPACDRKTDCVLMGRPAIVIRQVADLRFMAISEGWWTLPPLLEKCVPIDVCPRCRKLNYHPLFPVPTEN